VFRDRSPGVLSCTNVEALHARLHDRLGRVSAVSDLAKAIRYAIRQWPGLVVSLDDGHVEMDTKVVERATRPIALSRKNTHFADSDGGARGWAIAMTRIRSAKLEGVEPMAWLTDVFERMVSGHTKSHQQHTALPWHWTPRTLIALAPQSRDEPEPTPSNLPASWPRRLLYLYERCRCVTATAFYRNVSLPRQSKATVVPRCRLRLSVHFCTNRAATQLHPTPSTSRTS
jgi:hypothetical protein